MKQLFRDEFEYVGVKFGVYIEDRNGFFYVLEFVKIREDFDEVV